MAFLGSFADSSPSFLLVRSFTCCALSGASFFSSRRRGEMAARRTDSLHLEGKEASRVQPDLRGMHAYLRNGAGADLEDTTEF